MTIASAATGIRHVFLRDMLLHLIIGVHAHEQAAPQRVRINVDLGVSENLDDESDRLGRVLDYESLAHRVREIATSGRIQLVETLAEQIARDCLRDARVRSARVRVEKLDVFADMWAAGVEIERCQLAAHPPSRQTS